MSTADLRRLDVAVAITLKFLVCLPELKSRKDDVLRGRRPKALFVLVGVGSVANDDERHVSVELVVGLYDSERVILWLKAAYI